MRVAFLGLGAIGAPMARHLASGFDLAVWNRTSDKATAFAAAHGARAAGTPAEAARDATIVVTCLPTSKEVESLVDGGLGAAMTGGAILVDCTSGDPATSRRIAAALAARDIGFIDAPVSGGVSGAEKGKLTVMCGAEEETLARARPVLEAFGEKIVRCGPVGAGHAVKAINQAMLGVHIWALAEGLVALEKAGVPTSTALDVINASSGRSNASMNLFPERVMTRAFPRTFKLALLDKDVRIAADFAREHGVGTPLLQLCAELLRIARHELGEEADHVEATKVIEEWAGVRIAEAYGNASTIHG
jgi:3-hydroxyisobutyrate dehydrogenase